MSTPLQVCYDRVLPDVQYREPVERIALMRAKLHPPGAKLRVQLKSGATQRQRSEVWACCQEWMRHANIKFELVDRNPSEIRITFNSGGGAWSYIGTDLLGIPQNEPTMNLGFNQGGTYLHEFGHCLDGDTLIDGPRDLDLYPRGIPIKKLVGKTPWVYAWKDGQIVVRKASRVWLSKKQVPTIRVRLASSQGKLKTKKHLPPLELVGTPDHPVLLSDGVTWRNLGDLKPGDRVCSLYRYGVGSRRSELRWTGGQKIREHVFICEQVHGSRPAEHHCHHKDECQANQSVGNLEWKHKHNHLSDHGKGRVPSERTILSLIERNKNRVYTDEIRAAMSKAQLGRKATAETRAKQSAAFKKHGIPAEQRKKMLEGRARFIANGGRGGMYGKKDNEETKAKKSEAMKAVHARRRELLAAGVDPGGMYGKKNSEETLAKKSTSAKAFHRKQQELVVNHTVVSVSDAGIRDVYDMTVPDAYCFVANGVVVHNSLGAIHEHQNPEGGIKWNKEQVYRDLSGPPNNWDRATIDNNMFAAYSRNQLNGTQVDPKSIMMYQIPKSWTLDGFHADGNAVLSETDKQWIRKQYPFDGVLEPGDPTIPTTGTDKIPLPLIDLSPKTESIGSPGERDLFELHVPSPGTVRLMALGKTAVVVRVYGPDSETALVGQTNNVQMGFPAQLDLSLAAGKYYVLVTHAEPSGVGKYELRAIRFASNDPLLTPLDPGMAYIVAQAPVLHGRYSLTKQG